MRDGVTRRPRTTWHLGVVIGLVAIGVTAPGAARAGPAVPTVFEANHGQADPRVKFLSRGPGYTVFVTDAEVVLADRRAGPAVRIRHLGARPDVPVVARDPLPGRSHYFLGGDPARWLRNVPTYAAVAYPDVYPGIEARYRADRGPRIEQEFVLRPGADPDAIGLRFEGVGSASVDESGDLVLTTDGAPLRLSRPMAYQERDGTRHDVLAAWIVRERAEVGFALGPYDRTRTLVIDPVIAWATLLGGGGDDQAFGVAVDVVGNVFLTGDTASVNFPVVGTSALSGGIDAFVTKLDANGQVLLYSAYIGGTGTDGSRGIAVDGSGNAYVAGFTDSDDFPTTAAGFQALPKGDFDAFVVKLGPTGLLAYATYLGGTGADTAFGIAVDGSGRAHVTGGTRSLDFPRENALQFQPGGGVCGSPPVDCRDAFVTRLNAAGNVLEYSTFLGGSDDDTANAIALDGNGNAYVTGFTLSADFPTTLNSLQPLPGPGIEAFVARVDADAGLGWATFLGGAGADIGNGIAVGAAGSPHVVGSTTSTNFPATGGDVFTGLTEGFVIKLQPAGNDFIWSRSTGSAVPAAVGLDAAADVQLVANQLVCTDPALTPPGCPESHVDVVVDKRSGPNGDRLDVIRFGGSGNLAAGQDFGQAIAVSLGSVWVAGFTTATNFPTTPNVVQTSNQGGADAFVVRLTDLAAPVPVEDDDCFIATAAFGSPLVAEVQTLRRFRDRVLQTNAVGRGLVRAYYRLSPPVARAVRSTPVLAATVRGLLQPVARGAGFALDRPGLAAALAALGLVALVGLGTAGAPGSRRLTTAVIVAGLAGALVTATLLSKPPEPPPAQQHQARTARVPVVTSGPIQAGAAASEFGTVAHQPRTAPVPLVGQPAALRDLASLANSGLAVTLLNPLAPRPARRWRVTSDLIEGVLGPEGFTVTEPRLAGRLGILAGDLIVSIDDHPPTGLLAVVLPLQRDPDRATVVVEIDRGSHRLVQSYRVR